MRINVGRTTLGTNLTFEQGPIRPPNEAKSLLLRITRNCPWNQCLFCPLYKKSRFSLRTAEEIKEDIQTIKDIVRDIESLSERLGFSGKVTEQVTSAILSSPNYNMAYRSVAIWLFYGTGGCFLQDADNLVMKTNDLVEVLSFLRKMIPQITRVTTYSRSRTIIRKSVESLRAIREAGLDRVHVGLESGYDPLLKLMKKGVTGIQHIEAGAKVMESGMELSEYVISGLGGRELWKEHSVETAKVLNQINPHFIRLRSLRIPGKVPLTEKVKNGEFKMQSDDMLAEEIRLFISSLNGITSRVSSDHIMNLLEEVEGKLPEDKGRMLDVIGKYQSLSDSQRIIYRLGRRGGAYRSTDDLRSDTTLYQKIERLIKELEEKGGRDAVENFITELADQYI
ncbi:MAG: radical SAM protein [Deltaproteobacteria bacterium]|nr:radical SAM protein [Deltaproteobacteria bacterium]